MSNLLFHIEKAFPMIWYQLDIKSSKSFRCVLPSNTIPVTGRWRQTNLNSAVIPEDEIIMHVHACALTLALSNCFRICSAFASVGISSDWISASISLSHDSRSACVSLKCDARGSASSRCERRSALSLQTRSACPRIVSNLVLMSSASSFVVSRNILLHLSIVTLTAFFFSSRSSWNAWENKRASIAISIVGLVFRTPNINVNQVWVLSNTCALEHFAVQDPIAEDINSTAIRPVFIIMDSRVKWLTQAHK